MHAGTCRHYALTALAAHQHKHSDERVPNVISDTAARLMMVPSSDLDQQEDDEEEQEEEEKKEEGAGGGWLSSGSSIIQHSSEWRLSDVPAQTVCCDSRGRRPNAQRARTHT